MDNSGKVRFYLVAVAHSAGVESGFRKMKTQQYQ
jgi:hypothetical protein